MKTSLKWKLIALLAVVSSLFVFTGCKLGETLDDVKEKYNLSARVTYYAYGVSAADDEIETGAQFENKQTVKDIYYVAGSKPANIGGVTIKNVSLTYYAHKFLNWYHVAEDEEGNPVFADEAQTVPVMSDELVDFSKPLTEDEHLLVCADWLALPKVEIKLVCDEMSATDSVPAKTIAGEETTYKNGETVWEDFFKDEGAEIQSLGGAPFTVTDKSYTYVEYYTDSACQTEASWPVQWTGENVTLYAKYIKGDWTVLKTKQDVKNVFNGYYGNGSYYLLNDIDCADVTVIPNQGFKGTFQGNGHTISNLTAVLDSKNATNGTKRALFGTLQATAKISDVTFANTTVQYETNPMGVSNVNLYFLFVSREEGAIVENVSFTGKVSYKFATKDGAAVQPYNLGGNATDGWTGWLNGEGSLDGFDTDGVTIEIRA